MPPTACLCRGEPFSSFPGLTGVSPMRCGGRRLRWGRPRGVANTRLATRPRASVRSARWARWARWARSGSLGLARARSARWAAGGHAGSQVFFGSANGRAGGDDFSFTLLNVAVEPCNYHYYYLWSRIDVHTIEYAGNDSRGACEIRRCGAGVGQVPWHRAEPSRAGPEAAGRATAGSTPGSRARPRVRGRSKLA
jgi:hypothetical protein